MISSGVMYLSVNHSSGNRRPRSAPLLVIWLRRNAKAGYKPAMKALANLYMTGQKGFAKKPLEAEKWHRNFLQTKDMPENFFISEPHL